MFLTIDDYSSVCDQYEFEQITQNEAIRLKAETAAIEEIASYLRSRYDTDRVFSAVGDCRNSMVVQCAVNISLWFMVHRLPQNMGHERRECLYNDAIKWLRDVQSSKATPDVPVYIDENGTSDTHNPIRTGGMKPNKYDY